MLSQGEKEQIYEILKENDVFSIPKKFECASNSTFMIPAFTSILKFEIAGVKNEIEFNSGCFPKKNLDAEIRFENITKFIRQKLTTSKPISKLPKTQMDFM
jgi:hypothetical protein